MLAVQTSSPLAIAYHQALSSLTSSTPPPMYHDRPLAAIWRISLPLSASHLQCQARIKCSRRALRQCSTIPYTHIRQRTLDVAGLVAEEAAGRRHISQQRLGLRLPIRRQQQAAAEGDCLAALPVSAAPRVRAVEPGVAARRHPAPRAQARSLRSVASGLLALQRYPTMILRLEVPDSRASCP